MCGRMVLTRSASEIAQAFEFETTLELQPSYNIAPSQQIAVIRADVQGARRLSELRWGLIPSWAKDPGIGNKMINARAETAAEKPAFRQALRRRRCLIPVDGFYEWAKARGGHGEKRPHFFRPSGHDLMAIAGLWETWRGGQTAAGKEESIESVTLLTTEANATVRPIHHRMPVILDQRDHELWLDPKEQDPASIVPLLVPSAPDRMEFIPVSTFVNSPRNNDPRCIAPA